MKFGDKHFSNFVHIPYYEVPKHHNCVYSEDRTSDTALLPRPRTRRNPNNDWSSDKMLNRRYRSQSVDGIPTRAKKIKKNSSYSSRQPHKDENFVTQEKCNCEYTNEINSYKKKKNISNKRGALSVSCSTYTGEEESEIVTGRSLENKRGIGDIRSTVSIEEHEYLQFLLRITEDIIINNYILNEDIERVFKQHMEMNKHVLDKKKMEQHISNLALELNISEETLGFENQSSVQIKPSYTNLLCLNTTCECELPKNQFEDFLASTADVEATKEEDGDDELYYKHSLGRVTECTEPSNSSATVMAIMSNENFLDHSFTSTSKMDTISKGNKVKKDFHITETLSEIYITEKTSPEDSLRDIPEDTGTTHDSEPKETGKTYVVDPMEVIREKLVSRIEIPLKIDCGTDTAFAEEMFTKTDVNTQTTPSRQKVNEQYIQTSPRLCSMKPITFNRSTQSTSLVSNKKCDTDDLDEYISIKNQNVSNVILEEDIPLANHTNLDTGLNTLLELKLLGNDYDLTPEKDMSERYNFFTDAATMCHPTIPLTGTEEESLLIGNMYELDNESALKRVLNNEDAYAYRDSFAYEDVGSSSSDHLDFFNEYSGCLSDKKDLRYSNNDKFGKFESISKINSCSSTSSISVKM